MPASAEYRSDASPLIALESHPKNCAYWTGMSYIMTETSPKG